jgi:hypothetical protein
MLHTRFCIGTILMVACASPSVAASNQGGPDVGKQACYAWCRVHNKTDHSKVICFQNCTHYYIKHPKAFIGMAPPPPDGSGTPIQSIMPPTGVLQDGDL